MLYSVVICLKISIFVVSNTTIECYIFFAYMLWFAWKFLSLWYQTQLGIIYMEALPRCDLLENFYLCGIKHNTASATKLVNIVVICLKISIFVVSNTTLWTTSAISSSCDLLENFYLCGIKHNSQSYLTNTITLWFAWKFLSLWYQTQLLACSGSKPPCCDLLENFYLCGIKHNLDDSKPFDASVVICLKISIFVVSNTT